MEEGGGQEGQRRGYPRWTGYLGTKWGWGGRWVGVGVGALVAVVGVGTLVAVDGEGALVAVVGVRTLVAVRIWRAPSLPMGHPLSNRQ